MKLIHTLKALFAFRALIAAANEAEEGTIAAANGAGGEAVFDVQQEGKLTIPYGEYPHKVGLQKFTKESAEKMIAAFNSLGSKLARFFTKPGYPIYKGHPDVPGRPDSNPSAPAVGWVTGIAAENDAMVLEVKWGAEGQRSIENGEFRFCSPHWLMRKVSGGLQPVEMLSVGLTNNPRINVPAIANDAVDAVNVCAELATILGLAKDAKLDDVLNGLRTEWFKVRQYDELLCILCIDRLTASKELILEAAKALKAKADNLTKAENDLATVRGELEAATAKLTTAENDLTKLRTDLDEASGKLTTAANDLTTAKADVNTQREARIEARLDLLVAEKKITGAEREEQKTKLITVENDADLVAAFDALDKKSATLPTNDPKSKDLGKRNTEEAKRAANDQGAQRRAQIRDAVATESIAVANDHPKLGEAQRYAIAWDRAAKKHPQLFGNA